MELYLHIPFCARKCNYCDFLSFPAAAELQHAYLEKLKQELAATAAFWREAVVDTIFIGGGTPSLLDARELSSLLDTVREHYRLSPDAEITVECNPASTLRHKFAIYRKAGVNRLSIGLQSADNAELKMLGRLHSYEEFLKCYQGARMEGFSNINVDLINCLPMQSAALWKRTLRTVLLLKPEHLSVYNLIVEPGTPFYDMQQQGLLMMPDEEEQARIDAVTRELLAKQGYERYEISNWQRKGHACRHNIGYWTGVPYLGFGLGASSYDGAFRYKNTTDLDAYLKANFGSADSPNPAGLESIRCEAHKLSREEAMEEFMFLGLRMTAGVRPSDFLQRFGQQIESVYGEQLERFCAQGLMERVTEEATARACAVSAVSPALGRGASGMSVDLAAGFDGPAAAPAAVKESPVGTRDHFLRYRLTERGMDLSNLVLSDFLLT